MHTSTTTTTNNNKFIMPINKTKIVMLLVHFAFYVSFWGQRVSLKYKC